jgi:hypothetical protein
MLRARRVWRYAEHILPAAAGGDNPEAAGVLALTFLDS